MIRVVETGMTFLPSYQIWLVSLSGRLFWLSGGRCRDSWLVAALVLETCLIQWQNKRTEFQSLLILNSRFRPLSSASPEEVRFYSPRTTFIGPIDCSSHHQRNLRWHPGSWCPPTNNIIAGADSSQWEISVTLLTNHTVPSVDSCRMVVNQSSAETSKPARCLYSTRARTSS